MDKLCTLLQTLNSLSYSCGLMLLPAEIESKTLIPALRAILAKKLAEDIRMEVDALKEFVGLFQKKAGLSKLDEYTYNGYQGFQLTNVGRYSSVQEIPEYKVMWKLDSSKKQELTTKLRLQTMGGDFDVYKLIEELTSEFSS